MTIEENNHEGSEVNFFQPKTNLHAFSADIWSVIILFLEHFPNIDKSKTKELVSLTLARVEPKSVVRAFLLRVAFNEHLDLEDEAISLHLASFKQPYLVEGKIVPIETVCKNYHIVMNLEYL